MTSLAPTLGLATVVAVGLYVPAVGLPLPDGCVPTIAAAGAAPSPSPSCGGDLRECLRKGAEMMEVNFVGTYVSAKNVSRCVEIFNSCIHGGAGGGGNPVAPTPTSSLSRSGPPQRFGMTFNSYGSGIRSDCRSSGDMVNCTTTVEPLPLNVVSHTASFSGKFSGMTLTGTQTSQQEVHYETGCISHEEYSTPYTYVLEPGGSARAKIGEGRRHSTFTCSEPTSDSTPAGEVTGTWSASG